MSTDLIKNVHYVVIPELPDDHQKPFQQYLQGKTMVSVASEGVHQDNCAWIHDYYFWLLTRKPAALMLKYWAGFLATSVLEEMGDTYWQQWADRMIAADKQAEVLLIFQVPKATSIDVVAAIERMLQKQ